MGTDDPPRPLPPWGESLISALNVSRIVEHAGDGLVEYTYDEGVGGSCERGDVVCVWMQVTVMEKVDVKKALLSV